MQVRFANYPAFDMMFDRFFVPVRTAQSDIHNADVVRNENETILSIEFPGVKREDLKIKLEDGDLLILEGERKPVELPEGSKVLLSEITEGKFSRSFRIGHRVDAEKISAEFKNGILTVKLPIAEEVKPKSINIK